MFHFFKKTYLFVMILMLLLAGCSSGASSSNGSSNIPQTGGTPAPGSLKGKITVWMWDPTMTAIIKPGIVTAFNKLYPDVQVNWVKMGAGDVYQKLPLALESGTGAPDVAYVEDSHITQFINLGGLADLTSVVQPMVKDFTSYKWQYYQKDGKYYGIPLDAGPVVYYYRRDVYEKAGLSSKPEDVAKYVATWDSYLQTCQTIKQKTGFACFSLNKANNSARLYEMMLWQQGLGYTDSSGKLTVDSPQNVATLEELGKFWKAGVVDDQQEWTQQWYADFSSKTKPVAGVIEAAWMDSVLKITIPPGSSGLWGVTTMPAMKAGQVQSANDGGSGFVIPDQSPNKAAAIAFVKFIAANADNQNKIEDQGGIFPAYLPALSAPIYNQPDPFFNNEVDRQYYVNSVKQIPAAFVYGPHYAQINSLVSTAIQKYALGKMTAADALKQAATTVTQQTGLK